ncbi:hypothetical protein BDV28DRAFT_139720 [Aspergillus coremiiformis]|uniref:Uncharacterized protein n=1 Tax=Aspergillus coremiiformis TaxID=138285 RepID=A0A5N6YXH5_9EURO|nr:hypothetical protein BDV28DRAFT_139720 [Aspergillus coremiiformis]
MALLSHITDTYTNILAEHDTNILSDLFETLRSLSQAVRTLEGWEVLVDYLGEVRAREVAKFWNHDAAYE